MAPSLILAIVASFWLASHPERAIGFAPSPVWVACSWVAGLFFGLAALSGGTTYWIARRARVLSPYERGLRQSFLRANRLLGVLVMGAYLWTLLGANWLGVARGIAGASGLSVVEEVLLLAPFLAFQLVVWWGLLGAERALELPGAHRRALSWLFLEGRRQWGLVLPVLVVLLLAQDLVGLLRPTWAHDVLAQTILMGLMGVGVLILAPVLVRFAWPTRPLPPGELRSRLESVAQRHGFRFRDLLVWDTGGIMLNAVVTGVVPWSRFVLLTDALIDWLDDPQIEAIFGHEMGHIAHRHLGYLGFFCVASIGFVTLGTEVVPTSWLPSLPEGPWGEALGASALLLAIGVYFVIAFGAISRRFERQADIYGCKVAAGTQGEALRPEGVSTFVQALEQTADFNGIDRKKHSWRHGSIAERVAFLQRLVEDPEAERRFQKRVERTRLGVAFALFLGLAIVCFQIAWN